MQTTTIERVEGKLTVDARLAVKTLNLCEHNLYCLLVAAEKNAIDDCGELAGITRKHVEDAAQFLGITGNTSLIEGRMIALRDVPKGEYVRRTMNPTIKPKTYIKGDYDRASKTFELQDTDDMNRTVNLKGDKLVYIGFTY